ncbi:hypothetical protein BDV95DRAFT_638930 [Massariosphaeria phaeospora]|uniref:Uncharacterized protein n=1 Tax=Massariosphaeria phaeospora TaxID=100035 RepID=A0A7C8MDV6_9PLEO|nr:hypothetical protein BDV95DRAFT_638930 [Massariosphaeria phaeospora]
MTKNIKRNMSSFAWPTIESQPQPSSPSQSIPSEPGTAVAPSLASLPTQQLPGTIAVIPTIIRPQGLDSPIQTRAPSATGFLGFEVSTVWGSTTDVGPQTPAYKVPEIDPTVRFVLFDPEHTRPTVPTATGFPNPSATKTSSLNEPIEPRPQSSRNVGAIVGGSLSGTLILVGLIIYFVMHWKNRGTSKDE